MSLTTQEKLELARKLAGGLTEQQANLIRHAINYLRRVRDKDKLKVFLKTDHFSVTSQEHWWITRAAILKLVERLNELQDLDYILGWAWRLRKAKKDTETGRGRRPDMHAGSRPLPGAPGGRSAHGGRRLNPGEAERRAQQQQRKRW